MFARDEPTCQVCGRSFQENAILHVHHVGYLKHDHSNRMGNLLTVCEQCHTPANQKSGPFSKVEVVSISYNTGL
ncbi:MAG: HNH endonuclease [Solobacterium sp.]|nr:HNH endonuclease [Solobacterium sp.]